MRRAQVLRVARAVFVLVALACAWWGFRGRWSEIGEALTGTAPLRLAGAVAVAALGLALTGWLWRLLLGRVGSDVGALDAAAVFFLGQLGKYVPGSVWSVAAQAHLGRRHDVPARSSLAASVVFLLVHTATGLLLGGALLAASGPGRVPVSYAVLGAGVGCIALAPPLVRRLADRLAGRRTRFGPAEVAVTTALMATVWLLHGGSLLLLVPAGPGTPGLVGATAAFALAHAVGVLVVLAPAGVGAREGVLVALLAPALGVPGAAAVALLSRLAHALADFTVAALAAGAARAARRTSPDVETAEPARAGGR